MILCNWKEVCDIWHHFTVIMQSRVRFPAVIHSYERLSEIVTGVNFDDCDSPTFDHSNRFEPDQFLNDGEKSWRFSSEKNSRFRNHFNNIRLNAMLYVTGSEDAYQQNTLFNPDFYDFFMKKYMSIFPLWSNILLLKMGFRQEGESLMTNTPVELWFKSVKNDCTRKEVNSCVHFLQRFIPWRNGKELLFRMRCEKNPKGRGNRKTRPPHTPLLSLPPPPPPGPPPSVVSTHPPPLPVVSLPPCPPPAVVSQPRSPPPHDHSYSQPPKKTSKKTVPLELREEKWGSKRSRK